MAPGRVGQADRVTEALDALRTVMPALAFLLAGVPLASLLDDLGFFDAVAARLQARWPELPVVALWALAAVTTIVLNLDTTIVLLTPLYLRLARRSGVDPLPVALVSLLLASFASSVLPISNLTTLIAVDHLDLSVGDVVGHLALPSLVATVVGWFAYARRHPTRLPAPVGAHGTSGVARSSRHALRTGGAVVSFLLVAFTFGPPVGVQPWMAASVADLFLAAVVRRFPWRSLPVATAAAIGALAMTVAVAVPSSFGDPVRAATRPVPLLAVVLVASGAASLVNNIPATLALVEGTTSATPGVWAWLVGVNVGSLLLPTGALATLLWHRILRRAELEVGLRVHLREVLPLVVVPLAAAALAAAVTLS